MPIPMSHSRIEPSIRSRPVYGTLSPTTAATHLCIADGAGGGALLDLFDSAPEGFAQCAEINYVPGGVPGEQDLSDALQALGAARFHTSPSVHALLPRIARQFERMRMGTQVYLAGSETLIGLAMKTGMEAGLDFEAMQTEHRGTLARRMQCVHCKGITENVTTQPATCSHCGLLLLVRDHYSRRHAAFQGVNINAEDPSEVPPKEEVFP